MIITISGLPGSGKSTVGKMLAEKLGYRFYSVGDLRGKWALEKGMTINELNELGENEEWTDKKADECQTEIGKRDDNLVIDGRLAFHFIPNSFKVFLAVDPDEGARRIFKDNSGKRSDEKKVGLKQLRSGLEERIKSDEKRYKKYYGLDFRDKGHYDLVIDTTRLEPDEVVSKILKAIKSIH